MHYTPKTFAADVGGCAVLTLGVLSAGLVEGQVAPASAAGTQMTLGAGSTETTPPNAPAIGDATPSITGSAGKTLRV